MNIPLLLLLASAAHQGFPPAADHPWDRGLLGGFIAASVQLCDVSIVEFRERLSDHAETAATQDGLPVTGFATIDRCRVVDSTRLTRGHTLDLVSLDQAYRPIPPGSRLLVITIPQAGGKLVRQVLGQVHTFVDAQSPNEAVCKAEWQTPATTLRKGSTKVFGLELSLLDVTLGTDARSRSASLAFLQYVGQPTYRPYAGSQRPIAEDELTTAVRHAAASAKPEDRLRLYLLLNHWGAAHTVKGIVDAITGVSKDPDALKEDLGIPNDWENGTASTAFPTAREQLSLILAATNPRAVVLLLRLPRLRASYDSDRLIAARWLGTNDATLLWHLFDDFAYLAKRPDLKLGRQPSHDKHGKAYYPDLAKKLAAWRAYFNLPEPPGQ